MEPKGNNKLLIGVYYKPPNIPESTENLLLNEIDEVADDNEVVFNYPVGGLQLPRNRLGN